MLCFYIILKTPIYLIQIINLLTYVWQVLRVRCLDNHPGLGFGNTDLTITGRGAIVGGGIGHGRMGKTGGVGTVLTAGQSSGEGHGGQEG